MSIRFKRILAFFIDWNISLLPFLIILSGLIAVLVKQPSIPTVVGLLILPLFLAPFALIVFRDVIFKGQSLGKRIFGLCVYDKNTLQPATKEQRILRSVFFFLSHLDGIILLATGASIGDRAAGTVVLPKHHSDIEPVQFQAPPPVPYHASEKSKRKDAIILVAVIVGCLAVFIGVILFFLNAQKDSEEYHLAYNYLVTSEAFQELGVDESKIFMNQYSSSIEGFPSDGHASRTVEIGFKVGFQSFQVVCHKENGVWQVCPECTAFD